MVEYWITHRRKHCKIKQNTTCFGRECSQPEMMTIQSGQPTPPDNCSTYSPISRFSAQVVLQHVHSLHRQSQFPRKKARKTTLMIRLLSAVHNSKGTFHIHGHEKISTVHVTNINNAPYKSTETGDMQQPKSALTERQERFFALKGQWCWNRQIQKILIQRCVSMRQCQNEHLTLLVIRTSQICMAYGVRRQTRKLSLPYRHQCLA